MRQNKDGALVVSDRDEAIQQLMSLDPQVNTIAILTIEYVDNVDSTNMNPQVWD